MLVYRGTTLRRGSVGVEGYNPGEGKWNSAASIAYCKFLSKEQSCASRQCLETEIAVQRSYVHI